ncbi:MAG: [protein-PII] uridylyltransferase, partial [Actinomycetota bacterium]|nr:[protein-PII] uridylyltransferase [Actinomycetota bacterium]
PGLVGVELRIALADAYDDWLRQLVPDQPGLALIAVGGLGRGELAPYSDLDLVLLYDRTIADIADIADRIWYPIWDSGLGLDHSVRTVEEAIAVAKDDLKALLGLLDLRHVAGDPSLWGPLRARVLEHWRRSALKRFPEMQEMARERWAVAGEAAFLLEPQLKDSRGGLRDAQQLHSLAIAQVVDLPTSVRLAYPMLLDVRGELHRQVGRADDVLRLQELAGIASALELYDDSGGPDGDKVLRSANDAARTIAYEVDLAWRRIASENKPARSSRRRLFGAAEPEPERVGLARDVVAQDEEVGLARYCDPSQDPGLVFRAARAAAENEMPISEFTLARLAQEAAVLPVPWPEQIRSDFVSVLGAGAAAVGVLESLDHAGLLERAIPEWREVRSKAQHNPVHRFTVDRHLLEAAAQAAKLARNVSRPDLLLVGSLLHDIGKGYAGDHSKVGAVHAAAIAERMGFSGADVETIRALVRHHLLLPDTATRRDLDDPMTITAVAKAMGGSADLLDILHQLTIADAAATGPAAWSDWKAGLIADLVARAHLLLQGAPLPSIAALDDHLTALAEAGELAVEIDDHDVIVAAPDSVGVLYRTAGVLALHSLDVRSASIHTHEGMAVNIFVVDPRFGNLPDPALVRADVARALDGALGLAERLRQKEQAYAQASRAQQVPPTVLWFDDAATEATVVEFRAADSIGLLCRITAALERCQLDVRSARVSSMAGVAVDAFYVTTRDGRPVPKQRRGEIEAELIRI